MRHALQITAITLCAAWIVVSILTFTSALDAKWMNLVAGAALLSLLAVLLPRSASKHQR
ncbi:hypothetical protein [Cellulomonas soli]|uniref:hypothetical protein n=1 Tax=Cellulomonas soli TaxID=931535 RepID=UPI0015CAB8A5|nr:hypothetical protein [Cellulomonas soli]NYI59603.1 ABC-type nickel/cobalt efflux system permease component RcnA [Cellulomonas soli]